MRAQIQNRLESLTAEYRAGQEMLADLEARAANVRITMARISGAIQVLEELLNPEAATGDSLGNVGAENAGIKTG